MPATPEQAMTQGRPDVAEHVLRALGALAPNLAPGSPPAAAYRLIDEPEDG